MRDKLLVAVGMIVIFTITVLILRDKKPPVIYDFSIYTEMGFYHISYSTEHFLAAEESSNTQLEFETATELSEWIADITFRDVIFKDSIPQLSYPFESMAHDSVCYGHYRGTFGIRLKDTLGIAYRTTDNTDWRFVPYKSSK